MEDSSDKRLDIALEQEVVVDIGVVVVFAVP
jgi:hypothetical protein